MSQKDSGGQKGKSTQGGTGRRGNTKYRMQAAQQEQQEQQEQGKTTADLSEQMKIVQSTLTGKKPGGEPGDGDNVRGLWKSKVLASYHGSAGQPQSGSEPSEQDYAEAVQEAMISIIDRVFDIFQNSAYEFNKIAGGSELELNWVRPFLTKEGAPSWMGSNVEPVTVFTGRMSTRLWTLIMKGTSEMVQTYILPTSKLMTFNISSGTFKPYLQLEPHYDEGSLGWRLGTYEISPALLQPIARELFNALIRFAKSEGREDEEFDLVNIGLVAPKPVEDPQVEIDRQRFYQQAFLEDLKSHLDTRRDVRPGDNRGAQVDRSGPPPSEFNQPLPDHIRRELEVLRDSGAAPNAAPGMVPSGAFLSGGAAWKSVADAPPEKLDPDISRQLQRMAEEATGIAPGATAQNPLAQPAPFAPQRPSGVPPQPSPPAMPPAQQQQTPPGAVPMPVRTPPSGAPVNTPPQPQMMRPPQPAAANPGHDQAAQNMAAAQSIAMAAAQVAAQAAAARPPQPMNLPAALSVLLASLDREMEVVAKAGADAFALRDLGRADAALKFSARLAEYRQMSQELLDYYRRKR